MAVIASVSRVVVKPNKEPVKKEETPKKPRKTAEKAK